MRRRECLRAMSLEMKGKGAREGGIMESTEDETKEERGKETTTNGKEIGACRGTHKGCGPDRGLSKNET